MEKEIMLKMVDGGIINITTDNVQYDGCETCDYNSQYINDIDLELTKMSATIRVNQMYEYLLSVGDIMKIILNNIDNIKQMTEVDFLNWLIAEFKKLESPYQKLHIDLNIKEKV